MRATASLRLWPFWLFTLLFQMSGALHYTLLAPYGERVFPLWIVGLLIGAGALVQLLFDIPAGIMLDRFGYVRLLRVSTVIFIAGAAMFLFPFGHAIFIFTLILSSFGWLFFFPGCSAYILSVSPPNVAGKYTGIADASKSLGTVAAMGLLSLALLIPIPAAGALLMLIFALAFLALSFVVPEPTHALEKHIPSHHYRVRRKPIGHLLRTLKRFNPVSATLLLLGFAGATFYAVIWFVVPLVIANGMHTVGESLGLVIFDLSVVVLGSILGKAADTFRKKVLVLIGLIVFALFGTLLGFSPGLWFLIVGFFATAGEELADVALWAWLNNLDKDHAEDGFIAGTISFFGDLGWTVGPILAGFLYMTVGANWTIAIGALPLVAVLFVYIGIGFKLPFPALSFSNHAGTKPPLHKHKH